MGIFVFLTIAFVPLIAGITLTILRKSKGKKVDPEDSSSDSKDSKKDPKPKSSDTDIKSRKEEASARNWEIFSWILILGLIAGAFGLGWLVLRGVDWLSKPETFGIVKQVNRHIPPPTEQWVGSEWSDLFYKDGKSEGFIELREKRSVEVMTYKRNTNGTLEVTGIRTINPTGVQPSWKADAIRLRYIDSQNRPFLIKVHHTGYGLWRNPVVPPGG